MTAPAPLNIPLSGLLAEAPGEARHYDIKGIVIPLADDLSLESPIDGRLDIARTNRGLIVDVHLTALLRGVCSRCLGPAVIPLSIDVRDEVLPSIDLQSGALIDQGSEPDVTRLDAHHELELEPFLRDAVSLASPIAPLCRDDCAGLCIECGEPLGTGHQPHEGSELDPRLAALKSFRVDDEAENE